MTGKTADLIVVQKILIDTIHKEATEGHCCLQSAVLEHGNTAV